MKYLAPLMIFFSLAVFAGEYHHRPKPEVRVETSIQSDHGKERQKLLLGVLAGIGFCYWNPFDWKICHQKSTFQVKSLPGDDK